MTETVSHTTDSESIFDFADSADTGEPGELEFTFEGFTPAIQHTQVRQAHADGRRHCRVLARYHDLVRYAAAEARVRRRHFIHPRFRRDEPRDPLDPSGELAAWHVVYKKSDSAAILARMRAPRLRRPRTCRSRQRARRSRVIRCASKSSTADPDPEPERQRDHLGHVIAALLEVARTGEFSTADRLAWQLALRSNGGAA